MRYDYKCNNIKCKEHNKVIEKECKHTENKLQKCDGCELYLTRVYSRDSVPMIKTNDGCS